MVEEGRVQELERRMDVAMKRLDGVEGALAERMPQRSAVPKWAAELARPAPEPATAKAARPDVEPARPHVEPARPQVEPARPRVEPATMCRVEPAKPRRQQAGIQDILGGRSLEDLLGGRVLAWVGGLAVLIGIVLLFAVGVSRGWIGEGARTLIAGVGSAGLLVVGIWLHERRGRTDAALAALSTGISALFVTFVVGAQVYGVLPAPVALALAMAVGALATFLAVRWESEGIAALGIGGALL